MLYKKKGEWPPLNIRPNALANAQCGHIPGRKWTEKGDVVFGINCGFASPNKPYNGQLDYAKNTNSLDDCVRICSEQNNSTFRCSHFTLADGICYERDSKQFEPNITPVQVNYAKCGYLKDRI